MGRKKEERRMQKPEAILVHPKNLFHTIRCFCCYWRELSDLHSMKTGKRCLVNRASFLLATTLISYTNKFLTSRLIEDDALSR